MKLFLKNLSLSVYRPQLFSIFSILHRASTISLIFVTYLFFFHPSFFIFNVLFSFFIFHLVYASVIRVNIIFLLASLPLFLISSNCIFILFVIGSTSVYVYFR